MRHGQHNRRVVRAIRKHRASYTLREAYWALQAAIEMEDLLFDSYEKKLEPVINGGLQTKVFNFIETAPFFQKMLQDRIPSTWPGEVHIEAKKDVPMGTPCGTSYRSKQGTKYYIRDLYLSEVWERQGGDSWPLHFQEDLESYRKAIISYCDRIIGRELRKAAQWNARDNKKKTGSRDSDQQDQQNTIPTDPDEDKSGSGSGSGSGTGSSGSQSQSDSQNNKAKKDSLIGSNPDAPTQTGMSGQGWQEAAESGSSCGGKPVDGDGRNPSPEGELTASGFGQTDRSKRASTDDPTAGTGNETRAPISDSDRGRKPSESKPGQAVEMPAAQNNRASGVEPGSPRRERESAVAPSEPASDADSNSPLPGKPHLEKNGRLTHYSKPLLIFEELARDLPAGASLSRLRRAEAEIVRVLRGAFGMDKPIPKIDAKRLVKEMLAKRYSIAKTAKERPSLPHILFGVDVSGSTGTISRAMMWLAAGVAKHLAQDAEITFIVHANGYIKEQIDFRARKIVAYYTGRGSEIKYISGWKIEIHRGFGNPFAVNVKYWPNPKNIDAYFEFGDYDSNAIQQYYADNGVEVALFNNFHRTKNTGPMHMEVSCPVNNNMLENSPNEVVAHLVDAFKDWAKVRRS